MKFVTLSGVDGSGKSTQLALLRQHLEAQGKRVAYFHAVEFSSANRIARLFKGEKTFEPGKDRAVTKASWMAVVLRQKFLFLDFFRFRFLRRRLEREGFDYLLSDRSFYDSVVNLAYLSHSWIVRVGLFFLDALLPRSDVALYLDIDPETVMARERVPEQGIDYLRAKAGLFREKMPGWSLIVIDAKRDQDAIFQDILKRVDNPPPLSKGR